MSFIRTVPALPLSALVLLVSHSVTADDATAPKRTAAQGQLLDEKVVTATKKHVRVSQSPAIISTLTGEELAERGVLTLAEALAMLPGVEVIETYYGYTSITFRGLLQDHYNNKSALLLNGQPLYDQVVSSYYLEQIPISSVARIEMIRGPGGVLYGTNAYAGVINIITNTGAELNGAVGAAMAGAFSTRYGDASAGSFRNDVDLFVSASSNWSDGYKKNVLYDEDDAALGVPFGNSGGSRQLGRSADDPHGYQNNWRNAFVSIGHKGFHLNAVYFQGEKDKLGIIPTVASTGERKLEGLGVNLRWEREGLLNDLLSLNAIVWYDQIDKDERVNIYPPVLRAPGTHPDDQEYGGRKVGGQVEASLAPAERVGVLVGLGCERSEADPYYFFRTEGLNPDGSRIQDLPANAFVDSHTTSDVWAFVQADAQPIPKLGVTVGVRANHNTQAGTSVIPSLAAVYTLTDGLTVKALYGQGFRNPSFFEKYVRTVNILAGVLDLKPERIATVELGIDAVIARSYSVRLNGFYTKTDDYISRRGLTEADLAALNAEPGFGSGELRWARGSIYENRPGQKYQGIEVELRGEPHPTLGFYGNYSHKEGTDSAGDPLLFFARDLANLGLTWKPLPRVTFSPALQVVGPRRGHYKGLYPWNGWPEGDYRLGGYALVNLNLAVRVAPRITLSLLGRNILDKTYEYPEYVRRGIPAIPGGPGRAWFLRFGLSL